jgi:hypothetical protein
MDSGILMIQDSILVCSPDPRIPHTAEEKGKDPRRAVDFAILRNVSLGRESRQNTKLANAKDMGVVGNTTRNLPEV